MDAQEPARAGYIEIVGDPLDQVVRLTTSGSEVVRLARPRSPMDWPWLDWLAVASLGALVGTSELVSRYKDDPAAEPNAAGLFLYRDQRPRLYRGPWPRSLEGWSSDARWKQVLLRSISAMAFFRTSLFVIRAGDRDVNVGPAAFLQIFLVAADRSVDRHRASARSGTVAKVMKGVDFDKAIDVLPSYCVALMQNVSTEDQQVLGRFSRRSRTNRPIRK